MRRRKDFHTGGLNRGDRQRRRDPAVELREPRGPEQSDPGWAGPLIVAQLMPYPVESVLLERGGPALRQGVRDHRANARLCVATLPTDQFLVFEIRRDLQSRVQVDLWRTEVGPAIRRRASGASIPRLLDPPRSPKRCLG